MKKALSVMAIGLILVCVFTGCVEESTIEIEGTVANKTNEQIEVHFTDAKGTHTNTIIDSGENKTKTLHVGTWTVRASYIDTREVIDTDTLTLRSTDESWRIGVQISGLSISTN